MMNQYFDRSYRFGGRDGHAPRGGDHAPYRRPMGRGTLPSQLHSGHTAGGCGCGLGNRPSEPRGHFSNQPLPRAEHPSPRTRAVGGGGCNHTSDHSRKLLEQIRAVDFALYEVILYLDVYPHSCDALETYRKLKAQREALHEEYEANYSPLTAFGNRSDSSWDWVNTPFPWEYGAE